MLSISRRHRYPIAILTFVFFLLFLNFAPKSMNSAVRRLSIFNLVKPNSQRTHPRAFFPQQPILNSVSVIATDLIPGKIGSSFSTSRTPIDMSDVKKEVDQAIKENFIMVFSKSYCPYCSKTKALFKELEPSLPKDKKYKVIELDNRDDGSDIQSYLRQLNGQGTVPHVYINQEFIGGNSDLQAIKGPQLEKKIAAAVKA